MGRLKLGLSFLEGLVHEVVVRRLSVVGTEVQARPHRVGQLLGRNRRGRRKGGQGGGRGGGGGVGMTLEGEARPGGKVDTCVHVMANFDWPCMFSTPG